jgi:hypothetical protein
MANRISILNVSEIKATRKTQTPYFVVTFGVEDTGSLASHTTTSRAFFHSSPGAEPASVQAAKNGQADGAWEGITPEMARQAMQEGTDVSDSAEVFSADVEPYVTKNGTEVTHRRFVRLTATESRKQCARNCGCTLRVAPDRDSRRREEREASPQSEHATVAPSPSANGKPVAAE